MLDCEDFRCGLGEFGISISKEEAEQVLNYFDADHNGSVDFTEFLRALRGCNLTEARLECIRRAYAKLDVNGDGLVDLIIGAYGVDDSDSSANDIGMVYLLMQE